MAEIAGFVVAVKGFVFKDGRVLILQKSQEERRSGFSTEFDYDLPGGRVERGEDAVTALAREVCEEAGIEIEVVKPLSTWKRSRPQVELIGINFLCVWKEGDVRLSSEHESFEWLTLDELEAKGWGSTKAFAAAFEEYAR